MCVRARARVCVSVCICVCARARYASLFVLFFLYITKIKIPRSHDYQLLRVD